MKINVIFALMFQNLISVILIAYFYIMVLGIVDHTLLLSYT